MNNYKENKKKIEKIRNGYGEMIFRAGISHLMDVGIRHLAKELVDESCAEIMQEDDTSQIMTNDFKCDILRAAYELAQIPHTDLLVYIQREVDYDIFDGMPDYRRAIQLLKNCMCNIDQWNGFRAELTLSKFQEIGLDDDEIDALGFGYVCDVGEDE